MANPLLDLLPSDPATLKIVVGWVVGSYLPVLGLLWKWSQHHYKGQIETAQQRVALAGEQVASYLAKLGEAKAKLDSLQPDAQLAVLTAHKALVSETASVQIKAREEEVRLAEAKMRVIESERDSAVATAQQQQDQATELARLSQDKAVAQARIDELQRFIGQAHHFADGIQAAVLRRAARERQEYEANKDIIHHRFVKRGDARSEFDALRLRAASEGRIKSDPIRVDFYDHAPENPYTHVMVVGHEWLLLMRDQEGWQFMEPSADDNVTPAVVGWAQSYSRILNQKGGQNPDLIMSLGKDCIQIHVNEQPGMRHTLAALATIRAGYPTPMAYYVCGSVTEVDADVHAWRREHGTGLVP